jgi:hypothetical protein
VDEAEDVGRGAELLECFDDGAIGVEVLLNFARLDVKDVNQDRDVGENGFALRGEVGFGEGGLSTVLLDLVYSIRDHQEGECVPATIPQIQCQISHELRMAVLHVDCRTQAAHIFCDVIAEDDRAH